MDLEFHSYSYDEAHRHLIPPLPLLQVSGMRPLCCPEPSLAAPAPHTVAASGSPAPAPCVLWTFPISKTVRVVTRHAETHSNDHISSNYLKTKKSIAEDNTDDILYPVRRPMQCPILLPRMASASSLTGPVTVLSLHFCWSTLSLTGWYRPSNKTSKVSENKSPVVLWTALNPRGMRVALTSSPQTIWKLASEQL